VHEFYQQQAISTATFRENQAYSDVIIAGHNFIVYVVSPKRVNQ